MHAEVISVGTEILLGQITDTNSTFISQRLAELGIDVYFKTVVGDNEKDCFKLWRLLRAGLTWSFYPVDSGRQR